jgi:hypothetical protein
MKNDSQDAEAKVETTKDHAEGKPSSETLNIRTGGNNLSISYKTEYDSQFILFCKRIWEISIISNRDTDYLKRIKSSHIHSTISTRITKTTCVASIR